jgi:hypothetical protein
MSEPRTKVSDEDLEVLRQRASHGAISISVSTLLIEMVLAEMSALREVAAAAVEYREARPIHRVATDQKLRDTLRKAGY